MAELTRIDNFRTNREVMVAVAANRDALIELQAQVTELSAPVQPVVDIPSTPPLTKRKGGSVIEDLELPSTVKKKARKPRTKREST